jgi:hypothetical protein
VSPERIGSSAPSCSKSTSAESGTGSSNGRSPCHDRGVVWDIYLVRVGDDEDDLPFWSEHVYSFEKRLERRR